MGTFSIGKIKGAHSLTFNNGSDASTVTTIEMCETEFYAFAKRLMSYSFWPPMATPEPPKATQPFIRRPPKEIRALPYGSWRRMFGKLLEAEGFIFSHGSNKYTREHRRGGPSLVFLDTIDSMMDHPELVEKFACELDPAGQENRSYTVNGNGFKVTAPTMEEAVEMWGKLSKPTVSDEYNGYTIKTDQGSFTMAHRDGGVEVMCDGDIVWTSTYRNQGATNE